MGNQQYKYVFLVHPTVAVQRLREGGQVPEAWWNAYCSRKIETKEPTYERREKRKKASGKVVQLKPTGTAGAREAAKS